MPGVCGTRPNAGNQPDGRSGQTLLTRHRDGGSAARFAMAFRTLSGGGPVALAVSGGSDSMALLHLAARSAPKSPLHVLTVDHGLRPGSAADADFVCAQAAALGLTATKLTWMRPGGGPAVSAGLQARARAARYRLMAAWCHRHGYPALATAHTADDQAETVLMRLRRAPGLEGYAAMRPVRRLVTRPELATVRLIRPLLTVGRQALRFYLTEGHLRWREDPSNRDLAFERIRWRVALPDLAAEGIRVSRLAGFAESAGAASGVLARLAAALCRETVTFHPAGFAHIQAEVFTSAVPEAVRLLVLERLLQIVGGRRRPPRAGAVKRLADALCTGQADPAGQADPGAETANALPDTLPRTLPGTLHGCRVLQDPNGGWLMCREPGRRPPESLTLPALRPVLFDGRWAIRAPVSGLSAECLGPSPRARLRAAWPDRESLLDALPAAVRGTVPVLVRDGRIAALPAWMGGPDPSFEAVFPAQQLWPQHGIAGPAGSGGLKNAMYSSKDWGLPPILMGGAGV